MKFTSALSASALFVGAMAADASQQYRLRLNVDYQELNGTYLSTSSSAVGVYNNGTKSAGSKITIGENSDEASLTTYPVGIVEHALGLVGSKGYLEFQDLTQPSGHTADANSNETYSWQEFTVGAEDENGVRELKYKDIEPGWIASPVGEGDWKIKNYDGDLVVIQNYVPVQILLEPVEESS